MSDTVIRVENLSKKYVLSHQREGQNYKALRDVIADGAKSMAKRLTFKSQHSALSPQHSSREEFWALKDVSFEIKQGDRVGIIGRNGAGKSTLLKILSRIVEPTSGRIGIKGRVASLLEVGTGFHPELTGRENIFLNGAILGMSKAEIQRKFDEIVDFAEVEKFLDTPVKRYSSGMYVRLAFAVAAHLEPEILIVDEVLAVGDAQFQKKCLGKMEEVGKEGRTILFVSHNIATLQALCQRGILLKSGTVIADGVSREVINVYSRSLEDFASQNLLNRRDRRGKGNILITHIEISGSKDSPLESLTTGGSAYFTFHFNKLSSDLSCAFTIYDQNSQPIAYFNSTVCSSQDIYNPSLGSKIVCEIEELQLFPGHYRINVAVMSGGELEDLVEGASMFDVGVGVLRDRPIGKSISTASVCFAHRWLSPTNEKQYFKAIN